MPVPQPPVTTITHQVPPPPPPSLLASKGNKLNWGWCGGGWKRQTSHLPFYSPKLLIDSVVFILFGFACFLCFLKRINIWLIISVCSRGFSSFVKEVLFVFDDPRFVRWSFSMFVSERLLPASTVLILFLNWKLFFLLLRSCIVKNTRSSAADRKLGSGLG